MLVLLLCCAAQAVYHADFEKNIRGTITTVSDDPEMKRVKGVANVISQAAYTRGRRTSENTGTEHRVCEYVFMLHVLMCLLAICSTRSEIGFS